LIGAAQGLAAVFGISGILTFPFIRRCIGLNSVGVLGLGLQVRKNLLVEIMEQLHHQHPYWAYVGCLS
jgi:hypothetical protein